MAQININELQLIVENAMRQSGLQGIYENGWKETITIPNGNQIQNPYGLQQLRNAISQSILDALAGVTVTGTLSSGVSTGSQIITGSTTQINLSTQNLNINGNPLPAARMGDRISISDVGFLTWVATITEVVNSLANGSISMYPSSITGSIITGSSGVSIGNSGIQIGY